MRYSYIGECTFDDEEIITKNIEVTIDDIKKALQEAIEEIEKEKGGEIKNESNNIHNGLKNIY